MPRKEPQHPLYRGMWLEGKYVYFFFDSKVDEFFKDWIQQQEDLSFNNFYKFHPSNWQKFHKSLEVGTFCIKTLELNKNSLLTPQGEKTNRTILLKTSASFGSGVHPTTKTSLIALEKVFQLNNHKTILDCGTGSGILGIASAMLGAERIICSDINMLSLRDARENVKLNAREKSFHFVIGDGVSCINPKNIDLLVMNVEWPSLNKILRQQKWHCFKMLIISGFPRFLRNIVIGLTRETHSVLDSIQLEEWEALILVRKYIA